MLSAFGKRVEPPHGPAILYFDFVDSIVSAIRCCSAAVSSACWCNAITRRVDGRCPERALFTNCFATPSCFLMALRFPFSLMISSESSSRINFDPKSDGVALSLGFGLPFGPDPTRYVGGIGPAV